MRGFTGPRLAARCAPWPAAHAEKGGGSSTSQAQTSTTTDNRVGVDGDGNQIYHGNEIGGDLTLVSADAGIVSDALGTASDLGLGALSTAENLNTTGAELTLALARGAGDVLKSVLSANSDVTRNALDVVSEATADSAASSRQVADSQKEFLRAQTGQDSVVKLIGYGLVALTVGGIAVAVVAGRKKS